MEKTATRKKTLGGYPAVGVIISTTLALFVFGLFGNLVLYSNQFGKVVRENLNVKVYLKSTLTETQRNQLEKTISAKNFVAESDRPVSFVSKEQAEKDLIDQIGDYKEILGDNPLKDAFIIKIKPELQDTTQLRAIKEDLEKMNGVLEATYEKHLFDAVNKNLKNVSIYLLIITVLLFVSTFILVNNALRLALFSQRFLIRSMQLVGAKKWFIKRPFLLRSIGYGMLSGILASIFLWSISHYAHQRITDIQQLHNPSHFLILLGVITGMGIIVALVSTFFAMTKYLRMSLDELY